MSKILKALEKIVEYSTGRKASELRNESIEQKRHALASRKVKEKVESAFPLIGRGNVNHDGVLTHEEVEAQVDEALR